MFQKSEMGTLVPIAGTDPVMGPWKHKAFLPYPLPGRTPDLTPGTFLSVSEARAALASLDTTAQHLPNPTLLRLPTLRLEAQSTSALEGTYAPIAQVLVADEDDPASGELIEILNYVQMANYAFDWIAEGRAISAGFLSDLQGILMRGTPLERSAGRLRDMQMVIGRRADAPPSDPAVAAARFVPPPAGRELEAALQDLIAWLGTDHGTTIDPVIAAAMAHYQFETLHPYRDGNGRVGRLLIVLHLQSTGTLAEPTLTVSPWFEARRAEYYERLFKVSSSGEWDGFVRFFADGIRAAAETTKRELLALVSIQQQLKDELRLSNLRADSAHALVDLAVANPTFTVRKVESSLGLSYGRANKLVAQLVDLGILAVIDPTAYKRRFYAPRVIAALTGE